MSATDRFNVDAEKVVDDALRVALKLGHSYIQSEHLLLALIHQEDGITARALTKVDVERAVLRRAVLEAIGDELREAIEKHERTDYRTDARQSEGDTTA